MALVALTRIEHNGEVVADEGDIVDLKTLDGDKVAFEVLKESGALGEPAPATAAVVDENEELKAQIEELRKQLAAAKTPAK